jgi:tetratricopeptide (TPR) repeat protein
MEWFEQAKDLKPNEYTIYTAMYQTQLEMNDNRGARASIKKALELRSSDPDLWRKYIAVMQERFGSSTEDLDSIFHEALTKTAGTPNAVDMITVYAQFLEATGRIGDAIINWRKAIEVFPDRKTVYEAEIKRLETQLQ